MTAPNWSAMLAAEEARAMAGKPAFRVRMAAVAGIACPRCGAPAGTRCSRPKVPGINLAPGAASSCRERVWAMRALQRSPAMSRSPRVADVAVFLDALVEHVAAPWVGAELRPGVHRGDPVWLTPSWAAIADIDIVAPIHHGLVRLSVASNGAPVWVITEAGAEYAAGWKR